VGKRKNGDIFEAVKCLRDDEDIDRMVDEYWQKLWLKTRDQRWSNKSKRAFDPMKKLTKYNIYEKKRWIGSQ